MIYKKFFFSTLIAVVSIMAISGCSKKVTKIQQDPKPVEIKQVEEIKPLTDSDSFTGQSMDSRMQDVLVPIYFDYDRHSIQSSELSKLQIIASYLTENKNIRLLIEGHCDERGSSEYNIGLGESRARAIQRWLIGYGIDTSRLEIASFGKERPVTYGCQNESCHGANRRGEWKVLSIS